MVECNNKLYLWSCIKDSCNCNHFVRILDASFSIRHCKFLECHIFWGLNAQPCHNDLLGKSYFDKFVGIWLQLEEDGIGASKGSWKRILWAGTNLQINFGAQWLVALTIHCKIKDWISFQFCISLV